MIYTPILIENGSKINDDFILNNLVKNTYQKRREKCPNVYANCLGGMHGFMQEKFIPKNSLTIECANSKPLIIKAKDIKSIKAQKAKAAGAIGQVYFFEKSSLVMKVQSRNMEKKSYFINACSGGVEMFQMMYSRLVF